MEKTTTRSSLSEAVFKNVGLSRNESANLVDSIFNEILKNLTSGKEVKISSFGTFMVRDKKERIGRNPKTGQEVPISARQVVTFRASNVLKSKVDSKNKLIKTSEASKFSNNESDTNVN
jgi:integration host factor subunit alpha